MDTAISQSLPEYRKPPVDEVVCGVLFEPLAGFLVPHFGQLWNKFKDDYPRCQEMAPLVPIIEDSQKILMRDVISADIPLPRVWFMHDDGRIIQLQRDRFLHNWRKLQPGDQYPRYRTVFQMFQDHLSTFQTFVRENELGAFVPRQYEMTYVNLITQGDGWETIEEVSRVFPDFSWGQKKSRFLPNPIGVHWQTVFPLPGNAGRLQMQIQMGHRQDNNRLVFRFEITARGIGPDLSLHGMRAWFDLAHEWIVRGFADYTGSEIQKHVWELAK